MEKILINSAFAAALFCTATVYAASLQYSANFDDTALNGFTSTTVPTLSGGNVGALDISTGSFNSELTLNTVTATSSGGFSLAFHMLYSGSTSNPDVLVLTFNGIDKQGNAFTDMGVKLELNGDDLKVWPVTDKDSLWFYNNGSGTTVKADISAETWVHIGLTFEGNTLKFYADGSETYTKELPVPNNNAGQYTLTNIASGTDSSAGRVLLDNIAVYEGVLSAEEMSYLSANAAPNVFPVTPAGGDAIPEPATATLSLLALAGLAARRRRK